MSGQGVKALFVSAEAAPFAKVGGLADVAGSLPAALRRIGIDARLCMPFYRCIQDNPPDDLAQGPSGLFVNMYQSYHEFNIKTAVSGDVPVYFIDFPSLFKRDNIYGYFDEIERFTAFCKGVNAMMYNIDWTPDVLHANDWHTALIPALLGTILADHPFYSRIATVFSIHNLGYQGIAPPHLMELFELPWSEFTYHRAEFFGRVNLLKEGVFHADRVNTVSPTYAREILTPGYGEKLDGFLSAHAGKLSGIVNGIDTEIFNPANDPHIKTPYSAQDFSAKKENKKALLEELGLSPRGRRLQAPLAGMVTRLAEHKGCGILEESLDTLLKRNMTLVILGTGEARFEKTLAAAAKRHADRMVIRIGFDNALAHRIYAGADIFLMPSLYEPCGLGQRIAMRYGTIPAARATGGLADTIADFDPVSLKGTGFLFDEPTPAALVRCMDRALEIFDTPKWDSLIRSAMSEDASWANSANQYAELYAQAMYATGQGGDNFNGKD